ncbi:MAG TPA: heat-inducible transcriptional repressor HrcA [Capsulimonadaceae bacterium]|nr:heat-inducible transcriptional repressor HrcA [Capsulimonadaceae bacterium]
MEIDERKQKILQAVVWSYVETAEPVGSEVLAQRYASWGVKSATIRNELAGLAEQGYLRQPHTSAGRIPSDLGYRFHVDHLLVERELDPQTLWATRQDLEAERQETLERILRQTCSLLTRLTHYTSVATPPRPTDVTLRQVFAAPAGHDTLLIVALLSTGDTENRLLSGQAASLALDNPSALTTALNALNAEWSGNSLDALRAAAEVAIAAPADLVGVPEVSLYMALAESVRHVVIAAANEERVVIEGEREILRQPEFQDVAKLEGMLDALQTRARVFELFSTSSHGSEATVVIGYENPVEAMRECSVVTAPYYIGTRERGTLGVVGPTRMDYDHTLPVVSIMARNLSELLSRLA